jgi:ACS family hexuronate transporter-like MFS transporter
MSPPAPPLRTPIEGWQWRVVWLLFLATLINYTDRQALNQTSSFLLAEFGVPADQRETVYGRIEAAFAYSYAAFQLLAGFLGDRFSLRRIYFGAIVVWSAAGFLTGLIPPGAITALILCRAVLGAGEAFNWPCAVAVVRRVVPRESRGLANGIFHSGASIGALVTPLLVLGLVQAVPADAFGAVTGSAAAVTPATIGHGWRNVFLVVGALGGVWAAIWWVATRGAAARAIDGPAAADPDVRHADLPVVRVFALRAFWVMLGVGCSVNLCWHFFRTWFIRYLEKDLAVGPVDRQWLMFGFFVAADLGSLGSGYTIRRLTRSGYSVERSRKLVMTGLAGVCLLATVATQVPGFGLKMALFFLVAAGSMGGFAVYFSLGQDIVPRHTAQLLGIGGATSWALIATMNTVVGPWADSQGTFVPAIVAAGAIPVLAAVIGWQWPEPAGRSDTQSR